VTDAAREAEDRVLITVLSRYVSPTRAQSILVRARREVPGVPAPRAPGGGPAHQALLGRLTEGLRMFVGEADTRAAVAEVTRLLAGRTAAPIDLELRVESDIARARLAARDLCQTLGTSPLVIQKLATIVSELARNMVAYAGGGRLSLRPGVSGRRCVAVEATDEGPGIPNLEEILAGRYKSRSGLGLGILGTKRLADRFTISSVPGATRVEVEVNF
jgi:serine/threonine-protein kinase RsbT